MFFSLSGCCHDFKGSYTWLANKLRVANFNDLLIILRRATDLFKWREINNLQENTMDRYDQLEALVESLKDDFEKFYEKGNKAAGEEK